MERQFKETSEQNEKTYVHFTQEDELVDIATATKQYQMVLPSSMTAFNVNIGLKNRITNCNPAYTKMTPCVKKWFEQHFGIGYNDIVTRVIQFTEKSYEGKFSLEAMTGCKQPCAITEYQPISVISIQKDNIRDESIKLFENKSDGIIFFNHVPQDEIIKIDEVPRYTIIGFISDVGGIVGVFLGMSFWSLHTIFLGPIIEKLEKAATARKDATSSNTAVLPVFTEESIV